MPWLRMRSLTSAVVDETEWAVGSDLSDPELAWYCCEVFRSVGQVETIEVFERQPQGETEPAIVMRRTPGGSRKCA